jgi:hypothetical protein
MRSETEIKERLTQTENEEYTDHEINIALGGRIGAYRWVLGLIENEDDWFDEE